MNCYTHKAWQHVGIFECKQNNIMDLSYPRMEPTNVSKQSIIKNRHEKHTQYVNQNESSLLPGGSFDVHAIVLQAIGYNVPTAITMNLLASSSSVKNVNQTIHKYPELMTKKKMESLFSALFFTDSAIGVRNGRSLLNSNVDPSVKGRSIHKIVKNSNSCQCSASCG